MDDFIKRYDVRVDRDLAFCERRGIAYQRDMAARCAPGVNVAGENYVDHYGAFDGSEIGRKIHMGRIDLVDTHVGQICPVLDIGIGNGEFIRRRPNTFGVDVNPKALAWLEQWGKRGGAIGDYKAFTFWDVLEHVENPDDYFKQMPLGSFLFTSLPIFDALEEIRSSKHYKPGEHLYYFTARGFVEWMALYRFRLLERRDFETAAGRDHVASFAFVRDLPGRREMIAQYQQLHLPAYGTSAWLYFKPISAEVLRRNPASILDYGCGRSDLVAHFWKDGARRIEKYDPAIPQFKRMPVGDFDLVLCCDVMEHILMGDVDRIFKEIRNKSRQAIFTISLRPARALLPNGDNAHVTLLSAAEWLRWIKQVFGNAERITYPDDQVLIVRTF